MLRPYGRRCFILCVGIVCGAPPETQAQPCALAWSNRFGIDDLGGVVYAVTSFDDDGPGPHAAALYVAGNFGSVGSVTVKYIAKWDGTVWSPVGNVTGWSNGYIADLVVFDDDADGPHLPALYACGTFTTAGGVAANRIAKWDGTQWSPLGSGVNLDVDTLTVYDNDGDGPTPPALYAGGNFTTAGGISANHIAQWDGTSWSSLGSGIDGGYRDVYALAAFDDDGAGPHPPALYAGGSFTTAGGVAALNIARWDGATWSPLGSGAGGIYDPLVRALAVFDDDEDGPHPPALYAAGEFTTAGGASAMRIAKWDGANWSPLADGLSSSVHALGVYDDDADGPHPAALYAGGAFRASGTLTLENVAKWDGTAWSAVGSGMGIAGYIASVFAFGVFDRDGAGARAPELYAGGEFTMAGGVKADQIARWDGTAWSSLSVGLNGGVYSLTVFDEDGDAPTPSALFAGGAFMTAGGVSVNRVAKWDGTTWSALGLGMNDSVVALTVFDDDAEGPNPPALYVGGGFSNSGGATLNHVAKWDGSAWSALGGGVNKSVSDLEVFDDDAEGPNPPALYVGGSFTVAENVYANGMARWNGTTWSHVGNGVGGVDYPAVADLIVFDDDATGPHAPALYAGGKFTTAGLQPANYIAKWDGTTWSPLGTGIGGVYSPSVYALAIYDDDGAGPNPPALYVGGYFASAGGVPASNIAKWNGTTWSAVGGGTNSGPSVLVVFDDDGDGLPALYAGGNFTTAGGLGANRIARWDGTAWSALESGVGGGTSPAVGALAVFDDDGAGPNRAALYVGGVFTAAGGVSSAYIARWGRVGGTGDIDNDGDLDGYDYARFVANFGHGEGDPLYNPACDLDCDGMVTLLDYRYWMRYYREFVGDPTAKPPQVPVHGIVTSTSTGPISCVKPVEPIGEDITPIDLAQQRQPMDP